MTFLIIIIYLLGCIATAVLLYHGLEKGEKVTVIDLIIAIFSCAFSWVSFLLCLGVMFSDDVVFTKK